VAFSTRAHERGRWDDSGTWLHELDSARRARAERARMLQAEARVSAARGLV
jgi:hypothetical protein